MAKIEDIFYEQLHVQLGNKKVQVQFKKNYTLENKLTEYEVAKKIMNGNLQELKINGRNGRNSILVILDNQIKHNEEIIGDKKGFFKVWSNSKNMFLNVAMTQQYYKAKHYSSKQSFMFNLNNYDYIDVIQRNNKHIKLIVK